MIANTTPRTKRQRKQPNAPTMADAAREAAQELRRVDECREPPGTNLKIDPRTWTDDIGRKVFVATPRLWNDGTFTACIQAADGPEPAFPMIDFAPQAGFVRAQQMLDRLGARKQWTPDPPLEDDNEEPAPTRSVRPPQPESVEPANIDVAAIDPSPYQPRVTFPEAEIADLARSIEQHGQLVPILVRRKGRRFELVDGERRLRAAMQAALHTVRAEVRNLSDAEARAIVIVSAVQRKELNPLEEAQAYRQLIESGDCAGPTAVASHCGVSQGQVSNLLGLLKLPADPWHAMIADGTLTAAHARALVPWAEFPAVLAATAKDMQKPAYFDPDVEPDQSGRISVSDFRDLVKHAVRDNSRPMTGSEWDYETHEHIPIFTPSAEERAELQIIECNTYADYKEPRAMNVALWKQLQGKHIREARKAHNKKHAEKAAEQAGSGKRSTAKNAKEKPLSDEERQAKKRQWMEHVLQWLIATSLPRLDDSEVKLLLVIGTALGDECPTHNDVAVAIGEKFAAKVQAAKAPSRQAMLLKRLVTADCAEIEDLCRNITANAFWDASRDAPRQVFYGQDAPSIAPIAAAVRIDLNVAWQDGTLAPHYRAWFDLCPDTELHPIADALEVPTQKQMSRGSMIDAIVAAMPTSESTEYGPPLPKDLAAMWKKAQKL